MVKQNIMSQGIFIKIASKHEIEKRLPFIKQNIEAWDFSQPLCVTLSPYKNVRSLDQNSLSHIWYREIAKEMTKRGNTIDHEKPELVWKVWLKKRYLGETTYKIGKEIVTETIKTSSLNTAEMGHYLDQVYHWATNVGIMLSIPSHSEYAEYLNQQEK